MTEKWPFNDYAEQSQELLWLYTHCCAIGMKHKSDSGKLEHDIALFTAELCALLEKAEWTLEAMVENCEEPPEANCSCHVAPPCNDCVDFSGLREVFSDSKETLAAIKQWKEQT